MIHFALIYSFIIKNGGDIEKSTERSNIPFDFNL